MEVQVLVITTIRIGPVSELLTEAGNLGVQRSQLTHGKTRSGSLAGHRG